MKKIFKKTIVAIFAFILMIGMVSAETISNSFTINNYKMTTPLPFPEDFPAKKTSTGKYAYCTHYSKWTPTGQTYTKGTLVTDNGMNYILKQSLIDTKNTDDYFVYQTALWIYMVDKGIMPGSYNSIKTFKNTVNNSTKAEATKIKNIVAEAKKASANDTSAPTISIDDSNITFTLSSDGTNYVSNQIPVKSSTNSFNVQLTSAPSGSTFTKGSNYVQLTIPASSLTTLVTSISFSVNNSKDIYLSYNYNPSDSRYQTTAVTFKDTKTASDSAKATLTTTKSVTISKQDIATSKELPGAKLELKDSNGKVIDSWTSTTTPHVVKGLSQGTYTLTETVAPEGYVLSTETIKFTIDANGKLTDENGKAIDKVVMYNKNVTKDVYISKQDITTSKEVAGAELVLKDNNGKVIDSWTSTTTPHVIKNLKPGTYTLTETVAPVGYVLSKTTIKFTIDTKGNLLDENGKEIDKVVMFNEPVKGSVSISKQDITTKKELPGASLVVKDYDGNIIDEWISTDKPHMIENLKPGIYTLNEKVAPEGYILSDETITFTVKEDGSVTSVVMYNTANSKEIVEVENTASFKTVTSTIAGLSIIVIGLGLIFKNKKLV